MDRSSLLASIPLFESLSPEDLEALASRLEERMLNAEEVLFHQGDTGRAMFIIQEGAVDISAAAGKGKVSLTTLFSGQYFGELSLLDGAPRSATATATKNTLLLGPDHDDFVDFVKKHPEAALHIMGEVAERMRQTNELMSQQVSKNINEEEEERMTFGQRVADQIASFGGSWTFIFIFAGVMIAWMGLNLYIARNWGEAKAWDPMPFILLNLILSPLAALQAPVIMMSQSRQAAKDKLMATNDYHVNLKNEIGIDKLIKANAEILQRMT